MGEPSHTLNPTRASSVSPNPPFGLIRRTLILALLLYGYSDGVRSSRKLVRACRERMDFKEAQGIRRFQLRGFEKIGLEWQLICASYNLRTLTKAMA